MEKKDKETHEIFQEIAKIYYKEWAPHLDPEGQSLEEKSEVEKTDLEKRYTADELDEIMEAKYLL